MGHAILVLSATGNVGRPLVAELVRRGERVRATSRSGSAPDGVEGVVFDFTDPASFAAAFDGVDRLFLMLPNGFFDIEPVKVLVRMASERNVKIVLLSSINPDTDNPGAVEQLVLNSGTRFVILRQGWWMDNLHVFWRENVRRGNLALPAADGKTALIDLRDVADCGATALMSDTFDGQTFNLTGGVAVTYAEAAAALSRALGRTVAYTPITDEAFVENFVLTGMSREYANMFASLMGPVRAGSTARVYPDVSRLTGKSPRTLDDYAVANAKRFSDTPES